MTADPESTLVLLGLSGTGKTNFVVALDVVLDAQVDAAGLCHIGLAADRAYLQPLKEKWLRGEELLHTSRLQPPPPHHLLVRHPPSGKTISLYLPDLAGETYDGHFATRSMSAPLGERCRDASGFLLFLNCCHNGDHAVLEHPWFIDADPGLENGPHPKSPAQWRIEDSSQQAKVVDLLQFISEIRPAHRGARIAVVLSAWDVVESAPRPGRRAVEDIPKDPGKFFSAQWPLVDQFLRSNAARMPHRVFGVSARGGGTRPEDVARLTGFDKPTERILVVDGAHRSSDLSRPIRWVLDLPESNPPPHV